MRCAFVVSLLSLAASASAAGARLGPEIAVSDSRSPQRHPDISVRGTHTVAVWQEIGDVARLLASVDGAAHIVADSTSPYVSAFSVGVGDTSYAVASVEDFDSNELRFRRFDFSGNIVDDSALAGDAYAYFWLRPAVVFNQGDFLIAYPVAGSIGGWRVSEQTGATDAEPLAPIGGGFLGAAAAPAGIDFLVAASTNTGCVLDSDYACGPAPTQIWTAVIPATGEALRNAQLTYYASLGFNGTGDASSLTMTDADSDVAVAWIEYTQWSSDETSQGMKIMAMRLTTDGTVVAQPVALRQIAWTASDQTAHVLGDAQVVWNGNEYVLVWSERMDDGTVNAFAMRFDRRFAALDDQPIVLAAQIVDGTRVARSRSGVITIYSRLETTLGAPRVFMRTLDPISWPPRRRAAR